MKATLIGLFILALIPCASAAPKDPHAQRRAEVWNGVLLRLEALPELWPDLPAPAVPLSGRSPDDVLASASESEIQAARAMMAAMAALPQARARVLATIQAQRRLTEVDLWFSLTLLREERVKDFDQAALVMDAWLDLAVRLGRRDVLLDAAGVSLSHAQNRMPPASLLPMAEQWRRISFGPDTARGAASVMRVHGNISFRAGRLSEALDSHREAERLYRSIGDQRGVGSALDGMADVLFRLGQNEEALVAHQEARKLFTATGYQLGQGYTWLGTADILLRQGRNEEALTAYREARKSFARIGYRAGQAHAWMGEAEVMFLLGQNRNALLSFREARKLFAAIGYQIHQDNSWFSESALLFLLGQNQDTLPAYRQARKLVVAMGHRAGQGYVWANEATVLLFLGQSGAALTAYRKARKLFSALGDQPGQSHTWMGEATVMFRSGQYQDALVAYREARTLFATIGEQLGHGYTWKGEADVLFRRSQYQEALAAYREARRLMVAAGDQIGQSTTWKNEAQTLFRMGDFQNALRAAEEALAHAVKMKSVPSEIEARMVQVRSLFSLGREREALGHARNTLALLGRWRTRGISDIERTAMSNLPAPYDIVIPLLARKAGHAGEALALAEGAHAPSLRDSLATGVRGPDANDDGVLREERNRLQRRRAWVDLELNDPASSLSREQLRQLREEVDAQLELNELIALGSLASPFVSEEPISARARCALVRDIGPVLLYYVADSETIAFLLRPDSCLPLVRRIPLARDQLHDEVRALRHDLGNPLWEQSAHHRQRSLFDELIEPFVKALAGTPQLTIIPHGPLHELPFEALLDSRGTPLFDRWHVAVAPSMSALHLIRERRVGREAGIQEVFVGIAGGAGLRLPDLELRDVADFFGGASSLVQHDASTFDRYVDLAPHARHLLITTHGKRLSTSRGGYLEITPSEEHDHRLTAAEIAQIPLKAELVTLAACDTARAEAMLSDERLDLTRAFLIAGADAVLATRWKVPEDESMRRFLRDFYQGLRQGGPRNEGMRKDEALTEARRRSRARGDTAQIWAAWVLIGDAR